MNILTLLFGPTRRELDQEYEIQRLNNELACLKLQLDLKQEQLSKAHDEIDNLIEDWGVKLETITKQLADANHDLNLFHSALQNTPVYMSIGGLIKQVPKGPNQLGTILINPK